ncbi:MAG: hypothetical protein JRJ45_14710 [Deltaproteobacteria bacterium]|nr:hypothetical protein [Deltaproteobacteria bacterium]
MPSPASFIIRDAAGILRACPWHDIPTIIQTTKVGAKTFHLVFPGTFTRRVFYPPVVWRTGGLARLGRGLLT